ncbi:MAG: uroporphyrinogen-III synthase [Actinomycetota bacterium]|nr:uroporphyrinogen-III synthase [Actinomycetota bacterium]
MSAEGLQGIVVGVPAARRARETAQLVQRWGGDPLVGPTVQEVPVPDDEPLRTATEEVIRAPVRWAVFLTGVGTRRWMAAVEALGLREPLLEVLRAATLIPRGAKASAALKHYGLEPAWTPESETSAEIAEWLSERVRPGDATALQRHGELVPRLKASLEAAGARVIEVAPYRWELPDDLAPAERLVRALVAGDVHALVITSAPQVHHLFMIAEQMGDAGDLLRALSGRVFLASVGSVASSALEERGLKPDLVADPPRLGALMRALASRRSEVLRKSGDVTQPV